MNKIKTKFNQKNGKTYSSDILYANEMYDHPFNRDKMQNDEISSLKVNFAKEEAVKLAFDLIADRLVQVSVAKSKKKSKA